MQDRRGSAIVALLGWLLASLATAALAHVAIDLIGDAGIGGTAYREHAHTTLAPVALWGSMLAVALLLRTSLRALRRSHVNDPVELLARRCGEMRPLVPSFIVALGGFATLLAMEFGEQQNGLGHIGTIGDALGGNIVIGLAIVLVLAAIVTIVGLRSAHVVLARAVAVARALISWIFTPSRSCDRLSVALRFRRNAERRSLAFIAHCFGMRAPPLPAIV